MATSLNDSIFLTIKSLLPISEDDDSFDSIICVHINSVFGILHQLKALGDSAFSITGSSETWSDFLKESKDLEMVKSYIYLKVKMLFDPPTSSVLTQAYEKQIAEYEWRITNQE